MSQKVEKSRELSRKRMRIYRDNKKNARIRRNSESDIVNYSQDFHQVVDEFQFINKSNKLNEADQHEVDDEKNISVSNSSDESQESDYESASESENIALKKSLLSTELRKWALKCHLQHASLNILLSILKPYHPELPLSSTTLLKTDSKLCDLIKKFNPDDPTDTSEYVYFGISRHLQRMVNIELHQVKVLRLQFNMDGLPLFKSCSKEFWPILGKIFSDGNFHYEPFVVAIHSGTGKPKSVEKYLSDFIEELNHLLKHGILIRDEHFMIEIMCFICDRPARSFIKCIKGHGGYYACERCDVEGISDGKRVIYPKKGNARTNESFRKQWNPAHHIKTTPLLKIIPPIDIVKLFTLDTMHLLFLNVMKKLFTEYWIPVKLLREHMLRLSVRLMNLSSQVPCDFQRTTRSLGEISKWKATEFRFFLLYCGIFVLKGLLPEIVYMHFMLLTIACRILSSDQLWKTHLKHAQCYLTKFVLLMEKIYGKESLVLSIYSLEHLAEDVENMKCSLSRITAFTFESKLGLLKKSVRNGRKPLVQACKRMEEEFEVCKETVQISSVKILKSKKLKDIVHIQRLKYYDVELTVKSPDNVVMLKDSTIIQIEKMESKISNACSDIQIQGKLINIVEPALTYPSSSQTLDMFKVELPKKVQNSELNIKFSANDIKSKMVLLKVYELDTDTPECFVVPLLHSL